MISKFLKCLIDQYKVAYAATKTSKEGGDKLSSRNLRNVIIMLNVECCIVMSWVSSVVHPSGDVWQSTAWVESVHWKLWYRRVYNKAVSLF